MQGEAIPATLSDVTYMKWQTWTSNNETEVCVKRKINIFQAINKCEITRGNLTEIQLEEATWSMETSLSKVRFMKNIITMLRDPGHTLWLYCRTSPITKAKDLLKTVFIIVIYFHWWLFYKRTCSLFHILFHTITETATPRYATGLTDVHKCNTSNVQRRKSLVGMIGKNNIIVAVQKQHWSGKL